MRTAKPVSANDLGLPPDSYIYSLRAAGQDALAALSSDDSIRTFDRGSLKLLPDGVIQNAHASVTCLENWDDEGNVLATCGRDGVVRFWDRRTRREVLRFEHSKPHPLSALTTHFSTNLVITGAELPKDPPGDAPMHAWDARAPAKPRLSLLESHTDTVTQLALHPSQPSTLLSASTDGLVSVFDLRQADEDEALRAVLNHRSAVHHAGWLDSSANAAAGAEDVWVFGTDETLGFYRGARRQENDEIKPVLIGDVRDKLACSYVVNMYRGPTTSLSLPLVAAGNTTSQHLDLLPLQPPAATADSPLAYSCAPTDPRALRLPGAHGEEIVRDVFFDERSARWFTCGEDGHVRAWDAGDAWGADRGEGGKEKAEKEERRASRKEKRREKEKGKDRFKPY
ncbi:WD40-repeat-containing domain protein [Phyllosticta capitalensis]